MADGSSLAQLIANLGLAPERIAIELNQTVVRRSDWTTTELREGDSIEVVHFVGGGCAEQLPIGDCQLPNEKRHSSDLPTVDCMVLVSNLSNRQLAIGNRQFVDPAYYFWCKAV